MTPVERFMWSRNRYKNNYFEMEFFLGGSNNPNDRPTGVIK